MKTVKDLLDLSENFSLAHDDANYRFQTWKDEKFNFVVENLKLIKEQLIDLNKYFKSNLFLDYSLEQQSHIRLRSGKNYIPLSDGEEEYFEINFLQISNGKIYTYSRTIKNSKVVQEKEIFIFDDLDDITHDKIVEVVYDGLENAMQNSFLFI